MSITTDEIKLEQKIYRPEDNIFYLWDDFDFDEKEWLDVVYNKLSGKGNEINGSFTQDEMLKTLSILLRNENGSYCELNKIRKIRESLQVKVLADFFLSKALLGIITTGFSNLSEIEKKKQLMTSMN